MCVCVCVCVYQILLDMSNSQIRYLKRWSVLVQGKTIWESQTWMKDSQYNMKNANRAEHFCS